MEDKKNMKHKIFSASLVALASITVVSCDDYNDQFNIDKTITDVRTTTITRPKARHRHCLRRCTCCCGH